MTAVAAVRLWGRTIGSVSLADSHPERFGNLLIDAWLAAEGRPGHSFNAVQRLCCTGRRGMGALEGMPG